MAIYEAARFIRQAAGLKFPSSGAAHEAAIRKAAYLGGGADTGVLSYQGIVPFAPLELAHAVRLNKVTAPIGRSARLNQIRYFAFDIVP